MNMEKNAVNDTTKKCQNDIVSYQGPPDPSPRYKFPYIQAFTK